MSISKSLLRAAKLQEKIEDLRGQLTVLLDKARSEIAATPDDEMPTPVRRGRPKMLKSARGSRKPAPPLMPTKKVDGRSKAARALRTQKRSPLAGKKRAASPSGPLSPAVVKVLQTKKQPMNVRDILIGLTASGYQFNSSEPKKNLAARVYRLKGVKQVSPGLFGLA